MVRDNRTWVHPNAIRRGEKYDSGRYLHYFSHWHHFTLKMDDYRFIRWVASHNTNNRNDDPVFDTAAKKLSEQGWEALTNEEQKAFAENQVKQIGAARAKSATAPGQKPHDCKQRQHPYRF